jgi:hypothetical protein
VLDRSLERAQGIKSAGVSGVLTTRDSEVRYEGVCVYNKNNGVQRLLSLHLTDQRGSTVDFNVFMQRSSVFVEWPDRGWEPVQTEADVASGWASIRAQAEMADPAFALERIVQVLQSAHYVPEKEQEQPGFRVIRVVVDREEALTVFKSLLPPELGPEAYANFYHVVWVDRKTLLPRLVSMHLQLRTSEQQLVPIHMEYQFVQLNRAQLVIPDKLAEVLDSQG